MAENVNEHKVIFSADIADIKGKLQELQKAMQDAGLVTSSVGNQMSSSIGTSMAKIGSSLSSLGTSLSVALTAPLLLLGKSALQTSAQMEQISVSFEVFTGSAETAKEMLGQLKDQAIKSPMQFQDITKGAQILLGYGLTAQQVIPITKMLGDISGGNADKFQRLSLAFGQVNAAGRLMGQEARQMINAGFNPLQAIADKTGVSMSVLTKKMHDGQISVKDVGDAFIYATSEGGRFFGMADKQSQTLAGSFNKLKESATFALAEIGDALASKLSVNTELQKFSGFLTELKDKFISMSPDALNLALKITGIAIAIGPLLLGIGKLIQITNVLKAAITGLSLSGGGFIKLLLVISATVLGAAYAEDQYNKVMRDAEKKDPELLKLRNQELRDQVKLYDELIKRAPLSKAPTDTFTQTKTELLNLRNSTIAEINKNSGLLAKMNAKAVVVPPLTGLDNKPPGSGKELKPVKQKAEDIEYLRLLNEKLSELRTNNRLAANEIVNFWDTAETKKLKELKKKYDEEIKDYKWYEEDYTNITLKYQGERDAILGNSKTSGLEAREKARANIMGGGLTQLMNDDFAKQVGTYNDTWNKLVAGDKKNSLAEFATSTYASLKDFGMNLSVGFAEVAGAAFSGGISVAEAFTQLKNVFLNSIGDLLIQVGSAAIKLGLFKDGIEAALIAGGISGAPAIAIGLAAVAAGTAIKSFASQDAKKSSVVAPSMGTTPSVSSKASGSTYAYGGSSYSTQSMKLSIDLTGSITSTQTGYAINKSLETTLRVTGR